MGWYTDFFIADPADAAVIAVDEDEDAFDRWPHLGVKDVGDLELGALWAVIRGQSENAHLDISGELFYPEEYGEGYEGALVSELAPAFVTDLANLTPAERERVAGGWAKTEPMAEWNPKTVRDVLDELADFARRAVADHKPVLQMFIL